MITGRDLIEKLYSDIEEERTFSVEMDEETLSLFSDFCEEYGIRLYSKNDDEGKNKKRKVYLEDVNSHRGLGRSIILGAGPGGAIGGYFGKKAADKADREGKSDREIKEIAGKSGAKYGAAAGAGIGLANAARRAVFAGKGNVGRALLYGAGNAAVFGGLGALGGYAGARKNTSRRLEKRAAKEREQDQD